jgi:hypothetical protein
MVLQELLILKHADLVLKEFTFPAKAAPLLPYFEAGFREQFICLGYPK